VQIPLPDLGSWPALEWDPWKETAETLHLYMQIVGKTRLALAPIQNHWWNAPFYVTARGLTTSAMPSDGGVLLDIEFDFLTHAVVCYDRDQVERFWQGLKIADTLLKRFSTNFYGKISPVHFFWGSFDLAVTRFDGRKRSDPPADPIQAEAYSHEVISAGFWPGNGGYGQAAFYTYAAPVPEGLGKVTLPGQGAFNASLGEFLLDYQTALRSPDAVNTVLKFLEEAYSAAANALGWDRASLDRIDAVGQAVNLKRPQHSRELGT
jgi:hypothetical protein